MDNRHLIEAITRIPGVDRGQFTESRSHAAVHRMAHGLAEQMSSANEETPVCICTTDRAAVAAALLAGLYSGVPLLLPHAISAPTLADLRLEMPYAAAIVDPGAAPPLPDGVRPLSKDFNIPSDSPHLRPQLTADAPWVYLFTGGSTGHPKIWTKTPTNLLAETDYLVRRFTVTAEDRILATAPRLLVRPRIWAIERRNSKECLFFCRG